MKEVRSIIDQTNSKMLKKVEQLEDNKGKDTRAIESFIFEMEQKFKEFEEAQSMKMVPNGMVNGIPLKEEMGGIGTKLDIVKQVFIFFGTKIL